MNSPSVAFDSEVEVQPFERTQTSGSEGSYKQEPRPVICIYAGFNSDETWYPLPLEADRADYTVGDLRAFIANRLHLPPWAFRLFAGFWEDERSFIDWGDDAEDSNYGLFCEAVDDEAFFVLGDEQEWEILADRDDERLLTKWVERVVRRRHGGLERNSACFAEHSTFEDQDHGEMSENDAGTSSSPEIGRLVYFRYMKELLPARGDRWSIWEIIDDLKHSHDTFCSARGVAPSPVSQEGFFGWFHHCGSPCRGSQSFEYLNCFNYECVGWACPCPRRENCSCCSSNSGRGCGVAFNLVKEAAARVNCHVVRPEKYALTRGTGLRLLEWRAVQDDWTAYSCARNFCPSEEGKKNRDEFREMMTIQQRTQNSHQKKRIRSCFLSMAHLKKMQRLCGAYWRKPSSVPPDLRDVVPMVILPYFEEGIDTAENFAQVRANMRFFVVDRYLSRASRASSFENDSVTTFTENSHAAYDPAFPYIRRVRAYEYIKLRRVPGDCRYWNSPRVIEHGSTPVQVHSLTSDSHVKSCASCRRAVWSEYLSQQDVGLPGISGVEKRPLQGGYWRLRWTREYCESRFEVPAHMDEPPRSRSSSVPQPRRSRSSTKSELPVFFHRIHYAQPVRATCPMHEQPLSSRTAVEQRLATQWTRLRAHGAAMDAVEFLKKGDRLEQGDADVSLRTRALDREADCIYRHAEALPSETRTKTFASHEKRHFVCRKSTNWLEPECTHGGVRKSPWWPDDAERFKRAYARKFDYSDNSDRIPSELEDSSDDDYRAPQRRRLYDNNIYEMHDTWYHAWHLLTGVLDRYDYFYYDDYVNDLALLIDLDLAYLSSKSEFEADKFLVSYEMRKDRRRTKQRQERLRLSRGKGGDRAVIDITSRERSTRGDGCCKAGKKKTLAAKYEQREKCNETLTE
ncbi:unnamed protein product [Amoebophrya sp. A25]|nr:unnamed protein product [Amoebophrya sp. A25]|eukprot:GSA25T00017630001.1